MYQDSYTPSNEQRKRNYSTKEFFPEYGVSTVKDYQQPKTYQRSGQNVVTDSCFRLQNQLLH